MNLGASLSDYARPDDLDHALSLMAAGAWLPLAGGTDLYPAAPMALPGAVLDLSGLPELRSMQATDGLRIGAGVTWSQLAETPLDPALRGLQVAARMVGGRQIQNAGTLVGNICNASPAADGVPALLTLDAQVVLRSVRGERVVPLGRFILGPRKIDRRADELVVAVHIPAHALAGRAAFYKLGARAHLVISIASVAVRCVTKGQIVTEIAVAVGACSAVPLRLTGVERALLGAPLHGLADRVLLQDVAAELTPLDDLRATAAYRITAATELVRRAVSEVVA